MITAMFISLPPMNKNKKIKKIEIVKISALVDHKNFIILV